MSTNTVNCVFCAIFAVGQAIASNPLRKVLTPLCGNGCELHWAIKRHLGKMKVLCCNSAISGALTVGEHLQ